MKKDHEQTHSDVSPKIHIRISDDGEICAWGLEQNHEELLLNLTGNQNLADQIKAMSFNLCG